MTVAAGDDRRIASVWPPIPSVASTKVPPPSAARNASASASMTGRCCIVLIVGRGGLNSNTKPGYCLGIIICIRLLLEPQLAEPVSAPDFEICQITKDGDFTHKFRRSSKSRMNQEPPLIVELLHLAVVVGAVQEFPFRRIHRRK